MKSLKSTLIKFGVFATIMAMLSAFLVLAFAEYRSGPTTDYSAVFKDASRLESGDTVRVAGVRVGTVENVALTPDHTVLVKFDADDHVKLTTGTRAEVRYLNLVGDRYLELVDSPGSTRLLGAGAQIPLERTASALDIDLLLGGLRPVIKGLDPQDVNALTTSLIHIFQGQGGTLDSLLSKTSSFSNKLADDDAVIQQLIANLNDVVGTMAKDGDKFDGLVDRLEELISGLSQDRDPIGTAITSLDNGTASLASLLTEANPPLNAAVDQVNKLAPLLDTEKARIDSMLQKAPDNYRKLRRLGAYGSWIMYYVCGVTLRGSDLEGRTAVWPWIKQSGGRCAEP